MFTSLTRVIAENGTEFKVSGTGKPLRQFIYSRDLAKLFIWMLWEYDEIAPLILSVGEADEVSIKDVADSIVKHVGFQGDYSVSHAAARGEVHGSCSARSRRSSTRPRPTGSTRRRRATRS